MTVRFIIRQTRRFLCSYLHLSRHVADTQAVLHTQMGAELTSDWQVCHEITNQKHLPSFRPSHLSSHSDASQWNIYFSFLYCHTYFPPSNSGSYLKVGTCEHPASVATYGWSDCGNYLCHLLWTYSIWVSGLWWKQLKVGDLGDGGKIQMAEQWRDQSSTMHFSPHFSMQTDVISLSNWVYLSYADSFWQVITQIKHGDALETALLLYDPQLVFTFHGTLQGIHAVFCHSTAFNSIREQDRGPRTL